MSYYVMWCAEKGRKEKIRRLEGGNWGGVKAGEFMDGAVLARPPKSPIDIDTYGEDTADVPKVFVVPSLVVHKDAAQALTEAGVDNIDYYPAILHDRKLGTQWNDYFVGNVIGALDVIDKKNSVIDPESPPEIAMLFDKMVIDEDKCRGAKIFRLADRLGILLVSQELRDRLVERDFKYLRFVLPEDFA